MNMLSGTYSLRDAENGTCICIVWGIEDVLAAQEELDDECRHIPLSEEDAKQILANILEDYDPNEGVRWATLETYTREYIENNAVD